MERAETAGEEKAEFQIEAGEYLSGFHRGDRLLPVITLVILFNPEPWDAPVSIHEMLSVKNPKILSFVPDYRINLIAPAQIEAEDMNKFRSSLREVLLYIKYSKDSELLNRLLARDPRFHNLDIEAAVVINTVTKSGLKFNRREKKVDMCQAILDMRREERQEGSREAAARINRLNAMLIKSGRLDDLKRASEDISYQEELIGELLVDGM